MEFKSQQFRNITGDHDLLMLINDQQQQRSGQANSQNTFPDQSFQDFQQQVQQQGHQQSASQQLLQLSSARQPQQESQLSDNIEQVPSNI